MLVVCVLSLKGGVGKTSVVLALAGAAWERSLPTLVVDLDPQANATTVLDPGHIRFTASDVLADPQKGKLAQAVVASGWGPPVDLVAAEPALENRNRPDRTAKSADGSHRLRRAMRGLQSYELVLLDCPPSLGVLTTNALVAADYALVVTEPALFALHGAQQALSAVEVVRRKYNARLSVAGVVVNRVRNPNGEQRYRLDELAEAYPDLLLSPALPERAAVQQAAGAYVPVQSWRSMGAQSVAAVANSYLDQLLKLSGQDGRQ